ncbi:MAG: hypothetical protein ABGY96_26630 [bacterium]|nr:hypothetical protein [Gammaproteobacteria bacterium]HIL95153.1 hypothetical protein [Pseudomonadales bacterium]
MQNLALSEGLLKHATIHGVRLSDFSIEFSDTVSFLTLTETHRQVRIELIDTVDRPESSVANYGVSLAEGDFSLSVETRFVSENSSIVINASLEALEDTQIQDFVIRMKFSKENIASASIKGTQYQHRDSEIYRQFKTREASLTTKENHCILITRTAASFGEDTEAHMYIRDSGDFWIVHARLFPTRDCKNNWLRWINRFFWLAFSPQVSNAVKSVGILQKFLWYRTERRGKKSMQLQLIGLIPLKKGQVISQQVQLSF